MIRYLFVFLGFTASAQTLQAVDYQRLNDRSRSFVENGGFEQGKRFIEGTSIYSINTVSTDYKIKSGKASLSINGTSAGQQVFIPSSAPLDAYIGKNYQAGCFFNLQSGTSTYKIGVSFDGSTVVYESTVNVTASGKYEEIRTPVFPVPTTTPSTLFYIVITTVASNEPEIFVDDCWSGPAPDIGSAAQATEYASMTQAGASGCSYTENTSSGEGTFVDLGTGSGCAAWSTTGAATAVGTNDHRMTLSSVPRGNYEFKIRGLSYSTASGVCNFRLSDGTNTYGPHSIFMPDTGGGGVPLLSFRVPISSDLSSKTYKLQASDNHAGSCILDNAGSGRSVVWTVVRYPSSTETVVRSENAWWKVDANISGANPSLGTASVSSYTGIENGSLTLTNNSGTGNITAQIGCSSTNSPSGTTCSAGNESVSVAFTPLGSFPQDVLACVSFSHFYELSNNGYSSAAFQMVETATNAQTIIQEGKTRVTHDFSTGTSGTADVVPFRLCGTFTFSSGGQKMLRLMFEQSISGGTITNSQVLGDANTSVGQRDIHWEVYPLNVARPATTYAGSVTSNSSGLERTERAEISCSSSATITTQSGSWLTAIGNISSGKCALTIASGIFSATPTCTATSFDYGATFDINTVVNPSSATSVSVGCTFSTSGSSTVAYCTGPNVFYVQCQGPR